MGKMELQSQIDNITLELRSLMDAVKEENANVEEIRNKKADLEKRRAELVKELAHLDTPVEGAETRSVLFDSAEWRKVARGEVRSITLNGSGAINQVKQLFKDVADTDDILSKASFYYGANASTNIPVLAPIGDIAGYSEGATNVTADTDAGVSVTTITPKAHVTILPISAEALAMGSVNLESELPAIFQKAFAKEMHKEMLIGSLANDMKGIFVSATESGATAVGSVTSSATKIKISDVTELALAVAGKDAEYEIVMNPSVYSGLLADATSGEDVKLYKEGLIRDKMIEGVKVRLDAKAPNTFGASKVVAVAVPLNRYAIGVAGEILIDPIKVKGDTNTYFQATMFFNGTQLTAKDVYCIKTHA